jgi:hypothetical protein
LPCGAPGSRSHTGANGYHWSSQSNRSFPDGEAGCASSVRGVSAATADTESRAARHRRRGTKGLLEINGAAAEEARRCEGAEARGRRRVKGSMARRRPERRIGGEQKWPWSGGSRGRLVYR